MEKCDHTYPDSSLQFFKCSFKTDLQQDVNGLRGDNLEKEINKKRKKKDNLETLALGTVQDCLNC